LRSCYGVHKHIIVGVAPNNTDDRGKKLISSKQQQPIVLLQQLQQLFLMIELNTLHDFDD